VRYEVREACNILPILWLSKRALVELNKLPPYAVRTILYTLNFGTVRSSLNDQYLAKGMSLITTNRKSAYWEILTQLATRIAELAANPLPSIVPPPDVRTLRNAFWDPPEVAAADSAAPAGGGGDGDDLDDSADLSLGPERLVAFEVRSSQRDAPAWVPYPGQPSLRVLVEEIAQSRRRTSSYRAFDPSAADFVTTLLARPDERDGQARSADPVRRPRNTGHAGVANGSGVAVAPPVARRPRRSGGCGGPAVHPPHGRASSLTSR
jgi:hypothetical protein